MIINILLMKSDDIIILKPINKNTLITISDININSTPKKISKTPKMKISLNSPQLDSHKSGLIKSKSICKKYKSIYNLLNKENSSEKKKIHLINKPFPLLTIISNKYAINNSNSFMENMMQSHLDLNNNGIGNIIQNKESISNKFNKKIEDKNVYRNIINFQPQKKLEKINPEDNYVRYAYKIQKIINSEKEINEIKQHLVKIDKKEKIQNKIKLSQTRTGFHFMSRNNNVKTFSSMKSKEKNLFFMTNYEINNLLDNF